MSSRVSVNEIAKNFGAYQNAAMREPIIITENGHPRTVLMAYEDYVRLSSGHRRPQSPTQLSQAEITSVEQSQAR
jgi:prevent-host-death family protein